jgi:hypothetical protein
MLTKPFQKQTVMAHHLHVDLPQLMFWLEISSNTPYASANMMYNYQVKQKLKCSNEYIQQQFFTKAIFAPLFFLDQKNNKSK